MLNPSSSPAALTPWQKVQLARHPQRPHTLELIRGLCSSFFELRGDRMFADDRALIGGVGTTSVGPVVVLGHQKGRDTRANVHHNFGMPHPEGYRKALRLMRHAEKFGFPLVCLIDTPGAHPSMQSEERGQAQAIAHNLLAMAGLLVPSVAVVTGEGSSGGALAIGMTDRVLMLEHAVYAVASPEASASILWHDASLAAEAARMMKLTAQDVYEMGVCDEVIPEPAGGAHTDPAQAIAAVVVAVGRHLLDLQARDPHQLLRERHAKYRQVGSLYEREQLAPLAAPLRARLPH